MNAGFFKQEDEGVQIFEGKKDVSEEEGSKRKTKAQRTQDRLSQADSVGSSGMTPTQGSMSTDP
jgi:hypothetical protein